MRKDLAPTIDFLSPWIESLWMCRCSASLIIRHFPFSHTPSFTFSIFGSLHCLLPCPSISLRGQILQLLKLAAWLSIYTQPFKKKKTIFKKGKHRSKMPRIDRLCFFFSCMIASMQLNQPIEDICERSGAKAAHRLLCKRFMTVSEHRLIWETKRDKKTDDYDEELAKTNMEGGVRMAEHSSWNRNGWGRKVRGNYSMENQAKPDASYSLASPAPFLYICLRVFIRVVVVCSPWDRAATWNVGAQETVASGIDLRLK